MKKPRDTLRPLFIFAESKEQLGHFIDHEQQSLPFGFDLPNDALDRSAEGA